LLSLYIGSINVAIISHKDAGEVLCRGILRDKTRKHPRGILI
jgi:hypothetical protein